jgi:tetratricopeptide (TPR) repeat protein
MTLLHDNYLKITLLIILFFSNSIYFFSQSQERYLSEANHAIEIAPEYPDSTLLITKNILSSVPKKTEHLTGLAYYGLGEGYYYKQEYDSALTAYKNSLKHFINVNDTARLAATYNNIGLLHYYKADYGKALDAYLISLNLERKRGNKLGIAKSHQNIGLIYGSWERYDQELEHAKIALDIYKQLNDTNSIANMENNLGIIYVRQNKFKEALEHYNKALHYFTKLNDLSGKASALSNIGNNYLYLNQTDLAVKYISKAIDIFKSINNKRGLTHAYSSMGEAYTQKGDKQKAISYYLKSEEINKTLGLKQTQKNNLEYLYKSYKHLGDYKNANRVLETVMALNDSIFNEEKFETLADLEKKYNLEKSKHEAVLYKEKSEKEGLLLYISAVSFIFIIVIVVILYKNKTLKEKQRRLIMEQRSLRAQMNPHFIFNTLSAVQCMVMENKPDEASKYLTDLTRLIRKVLQYSREDKITLKQEKELLQQYFYLQNKRFDNKIRFNIICDSEIPEDKTLIPPMLAQPFIENAIEHGELTKYDDGMITLSFKKTDGKLILEIEDNGVGINNAKDYGHDKNYKSMAFSIVRDRLKLLNYDSKYIRHELKIVDLSKENKRGTRIEFSIPFETIN